MICNLSLGTTSSIINTFRDYETCVLYLVKNWFQLDRDNYFCIWEEPSYCNIGLCMMGKSENEIMILEKGLTRIIKVRENKNKDGRTDSVSYESRQVYHSEPSPIGSMSPTV
jgi:hypothetical protein